MKFSTTLLGLIASQATTTLATPSTPAEECGALGVMDWSVEDVPATVNATDLRTCREHPSQFSVNDNEKRGIDRGCIKNWTEGKCSKDGYCWKTCGHKDGLSGVLFKNKKWCWLAWTEGRGDWIKCKSDADCAKGKIGKGDCAKGSCDACGCGCT